MKQFKWFQLNGVHDAVATRYWVFVWEQSHRKTSWLRTWARAAV